MPRAYPPFFFCQLTSGMVFSQLRFSRRGPQHIWQKRFYDFNVWTEHKRIEKLRYMHRNPVNRGLVASPELWRWSSFRAYWGGYPRRTRLWNPTLTSQEARR